MKVEKSESGSDISSDSSWTVIEEVQETSISTRRNNPEPNQNLGLEVIKTTEVISFSDLSRTKENDFVKVSVSKVSVNQSSDEESEADRNETKEDGFLTFDEYLQEKMLEHDYEYPNQFVFTKKLGKTKKSSKRRTKCKAETIGVLSLCASLLTVTGIGLLCLIFPENVDPKNFDTIKSNCQAIATNDSLDYNNIVASFNRTMEVLEAANNSKILSKSANSLTNKVEYKHKPFRRHIGPTNEIATSRYRYNRKHRNGISNSNIFRNDVCYPKRNNGVCYANEDPRLHLRDSGKQSNKTIELTKLIQEANMKSNPTKIQQTNALTTLQSVLASTNLKKIIRSIIHDICILKLITYLNKNKEPKESIRKKCNKGQHKASKRRLFEAIAEGMEKICYENNKKRSIKIAKRKNESKKAVSKNDERSPSTSLSFVTPTRDIIRQNFSLQFSRPSSKNPIKSDLILKFENGKSECERRFEELDSQRRISQEVCSKHKINIQQIKQQYRNEIDAIKGSNVEPIVRLHRIQSLREKYKLQLKKNRETYIREMSKMKRMRAKMLKDLCTQKKIDLKTKDAAVGSYVVPMDEDFQSRLKQMKEKEVSSFNFKALQENTEPVFTLPNYNNGKFQFSSSPIFEDFIKKNEICSSKNNDQFIIEKGLSISPKPESSSSDLTKPSDNDVNEPRLEQFVDNNPVVSQDYDLERAEEGKIMQSHLYKIAFERKGPMIENFDNIKWRQKRAEPWGKHRRQSSKQDPLKCYKPNIMLNKPGKL